MKKIYTLVLLSTLPWTTAFAQDQTFAQDQKIITPAELDAVLKQQAQQSAPIVPGIAQATVPTGFSDVIQNVAPRAPTPDDPETIRRKELFDMKQRQRVAEHVAQASQQPTTATAAGITTIYEFNDDKVYIVYAGMGLVTDVQLAPGERVIDANGGDTARWTLTRTSSGVGPDTRTHIVLRPKYSGIRTNLLLTTDRRSYHLDVRAVEDWAMPAVRWTYPQEELAALISTRDDETNIVEQSEPVKAVDPEELDFNFAILPRGKRPAWTPTSVFDDGLKTYLQMPSNLQANDAPVFFVMEKKEPLATTFRVKGNLYIVDRLFEEGELRVGTNAVRIVRHPKRRFFSVQPGAQ